MIPRSSWRRGDAVPLDPATGSVDASAATLSATDCGSVSVLHLDPGGTTERSAVGFGQLVLVVAGSGDVEIGNERAPVRTGDALRWPRDVPHQLRTEEGLSAVIVTYAEEPDSWRVVRIGPDGQRWVAAVFGDTDRARDYRERLREELEPGEDVALE